MTRTFRMERGTLDPSHSYVALPDHYLMDAIFAETIGETVDYGTLFAYLFRRFGYPNTGWDPYKNLARYILTSPETDLFLDVVPYVGGASTIHFSFLIPQEKAETIRRRGDRAPLDAWHARAASWYQATHALPVWLPDAIAAAGHLVSETFTDWKDAFPFLSLFTDDLSREREPERTYGAFYDEVTDGYGAIEPEPPRSTRSRDWRAWPDDDQEKMYFRAAAICLGDLRRPILVRSARINALGRVPDSARGYLIKTPAVAGYASGMIGNADPVGMDNLHALALTLGKGHVTRGVTRILAAFPAEMAALDHEAYDGQ